MTIEQLAGIIKPASLEAMEASKRRWRYKCMPLGSMGAFQSIIVRMAGMQRKEIPEMKKKLAVVIAADNGIVEEGVSQSDSSVTTQVVKNMLCKQSGVSILAEYNGCGLHIINLGMKERTPINGVDWHPLMYGTDNMAKGPAMSKKTAEEAILYGAGQVMKQAEEGTDIFTIGEMGIGNTSTSSAVLSVLTGLTPEEVTGKGAGLSSDGLAKKIQAVRRAVDINCPDKTDAVDVLSKVGGLDIAGMTGCYLGIAASGKTAVIDGFISSVAALAAVRICPNARDYMLASHRSAEPGAAAALEAVGLSALLDGDMHLGEGSGAVMFLPLLEEALLIYNRLPSFDEGNVETYEEYN